jgi:hypothetical protein
MPTASESRTSVTPSPPVSTPPTAGAIRTSYPGIKKLVIVKSRWNNTPAGRSIINSIALYNAGLATAVAARSTAAMKTLYAESCTACEADVARLDQIIASHEHFEQGGKAPSWDSIAIFIKSRVSESTYLVAVDENTSALTVRSESGAVVSRASAVAYRSTYTVARTSAGYRLISYSDGS